jgi:hypothetical protein
VAEPYAYALWRVVPDLERGEQLNAGVVLFSRRLGYLDARVALDEARLLALTGVCDVAAIRAALDHRLAVARGEPEGGPTADLPPSERFGFLTAPASTVVQPGPVHTGLCEDAEATLERLFARLVLAG